MPVNLLQKTKPGKRLLFAGIVFLILAIIQWPVFWVPASDLLVLKGHVAEMHDTLIIDRMVNEQISKRLRPIWKADYNFRLAEYRYAFHITEFLDLEFNRQQAKTFAQRLLHTDTLLIGIDPRDAAATSPEIYEISDRRGIVFYTKYEMSATRQNIFLFFMAGALILCGTGGWRMWKHRRQF